MKKIIAGIALTLALAGCGGTQSNMDWNNYSPEVKTRIDNMAKQGDCAGLQEQFDIASKHNSNVDLMKYINDKIERCH